QLLDETQEIFLASTKGKAIRFAATDARETKSRTGIGVQGMGPKGDIKVVSLAVLNQTGTTLEEREKYLRAAPWKNNEAVSELSEERVAEMAEKEQFILTITSRGYGKISSSFEYRVTGRGGKGVVNIGEPSEKDRNGPVVASFPVRHGDQIMLVTDQGKLIRLGVDFRHLVESGFDELKGWAVYGRASSGNRLFNVAENEQIVSVARIEDSDDEEMPDADGLSDPATDTGAPDAPKTGE
ncbi:MAG: DNA gyrase C-terminal beta-propeller domain-containing protein, partial [Pseudomonadota bacterium]